MLITHLYLVLLWRPHSSVTEDCDAPRWSVWSRHHCVLDIEKRGWVTDPCRVHTQGLLAVLIWTICRGRESKSLYVTHSAGAKRAVYAGKWSGLRKVDVLASYGSTCHKLESSERRGSQLRKCLREQAMCYQPVRSTRPWPLHQLQPTDSCPVWFSILTSSDDF